MTEERITINGHIYEEDGWCTKFPPTTEKQAKAAVPRWNQELQGRYHVKTMGMFSAKKHEAMSKYHGKPIWGLMFWKFVGYEKQKK